MARKGLTGQLNMFDLFKSLDNEPMGEVQMVSLMPEEEPEVEESSAVEAISEVVESPEVMPELELEQVPEIVQAPEQVSEYVSEPVPESEQDSESKQVPEPESQKKIRVKKAEKSEKSEKSESPVMCRQYEIDGKQLEVAYMNYNKVRITREGEEPEIYVFDSSKEAVDYYVQRMQELEPEE